jgi:hypothetical protein
MDLLSMARQPSRRRQPERPDSGAPSGRWGDGRPKAKPIPYTAAERAELAAARDEDKLIEAELDRELGPLDGMRDLFR